MTRTQEHPGTARAGAGVEDIVWIRDELERIADADEGTHASLQALAATCDELRFTVSQFLPAIRELEVLADSCIGVQERAGGGAFDALELDAYSETHELCRVLSAQAADLDGLQAQIAASGAALGEDTARRVARWRRLRSRVSRFTRSSLGALVRRIDEALAAGDASDGTCLEFSGPDLECENGWSGALETLLLELASFVSQSGRAMALSVEAGAHADVLRIAPREGAGFDSGWAPALRQMAAAVGGQTVAVEGGGTGLALQVPVLQAEVPVLVIRVADRTLGCAMSRLKAVVRRGDVEHADDAAVQVDGVSYPLVAPVASHGEQTEAGRYLALIERRGERIALPFDAIEGSQRVRILRMGEPLPMLSLASTAAILDDGRTVPVLDDDRLIDAVRDARQPADDEAPAGTAHEVLVVDDSVTIRKVTERMLVRNGYAVILARDGRDALDVLRERTPALILLDIEMPRMNGFQLLEAMSGDPRLSAIPVVIISSRSGPKHQEQAASLGVSHFLGKPFQEQALLDVMDELLR